MIVFPIARRLNVIAIGLSAFIIGVGAATAADDDAPAPDRPHLKLDRSTKLDPKQKYGSIVITSSDVEIDGQGAWLIGQESGSTKERKGTAIVIAGMSNVTLKNINAKGWETGIRLTDAKGCTIEDCDLSHNFHDPDFGWGENGRRGGIVLERVVGTTLRRNKANQVWDGCVLVNSDDNVIEDNDFSHTSNTCLKLWTASRNTIRNNKLSHGIRISPGEVHARDSTSVLIESGSNDNLFVKNDCTHGGDGIFVRVLNGWCSTGNRFEENDCSYANNNGFECWAPHNVFIKNKANYCSYGFWLGGSDDTRLIGNEASFNGLPTGQHNSPHLPNQGHAGIVFMFGPSSHTVARNNVCHGNNGAGIALIGDLESKGQKWKAYHWIIEDNRLSENRWGIYAQYADWLTMAGNKFDANSLKDVQLGEGVTRVIQEPNPSGNTRLPPSATLSGPTSVRVGQANTWIASTNPDVDQNASDKTDVERSKNVSYTWDVSDGQFYEGAELKHTFTKEGFYRIGLNVSNGSRSDLAWRDVYVVRDVVEIGTEGNAADWSVEDFHERTRSPQQVSQASFEDSSTDCLVGNSCLHVAINPYAGFRVALNYPKSNDANWSLQGKKAVVFWLQCINEDVTGWQGGPFVVIKGTDHQVRRIEPKSGLDLMRQLENNEAREGWRLMRIPLNGDTQWQAEGDSIETARSLSIAFDSWGAPPLQFWIDGLSIE